MGENDSQIRSRQKYCAGSGNALHTIQAAVDLVCDQIDNAGNQPTIQLADGTYTSAVFLRRYAGAAVPKIVGNNGTPANVVISTTNITAIVARRAGSWDLRDFKIQTTTAGNGIEAVGQTSIFFRNLNFGATVN